MTDSSPISFDLSSFFGNVDLEANQIDEILASSFDHVFPLGESLSSYNPPEPSLLFLLKGQLRHIITVEGSSSFVTLSKYSTPFVYNLESLLYDFNNQDILICSTVCHFRVVPFHLFRSLLDQSILFKTQVFIFQSFHTLALLSSSTTLQLSDLKIQCKLFSENLKVSHVNDSVEFENLSRLSSHLYLGQHHNDVSYGSQIDQTQHLLFPIRLFSTPLKSVPSKKSNSDLKLPIYSNSQSDLVESSTKPSSDDKKQIVKSDSSVYPRPSLTDDTDSFKSRIKTYISDDDPISAATSLFRSLAFYFNLPIKRDLILRIFTDKYSGSSEPISLDFCAALSESLGLQTQLLSLPINQIGRVQVPAFIKLGSSELALILSNDKKGLTLSRPSKGLVTLSPSELTLLLDASDSVSVLICRKTDITPEKKFGLSWFLPAIRRHKRSLIEVFIASFFVQLFQLMNPLIVQQIIDKVIGQGGTGTLPVLAFLIFIFALFENILTALRTNLFIETTNRIDISLGEQVIDHLLRLPLQYFDKRPVGELSSRLSELENIRSFLTGTALTVVLDVVFSIIYIAVMLMYSWILTIVSLLLAPILGIITYALSPILRGQLRAKAELNATTQNHLVEVLTGIQTVKAQNFETNARWRWKKRYSDYISKSYTNAVTSTSSSALTQFLNQASNLSVLCVGTYLVILGQISLGQLIAFRIISGYVTSPLLRLSNLYQSFQQTSISLERLADIIDTPPESSEKDQSNIPMPRIEGSVKYEDVSFAFKPNTPLQLSNVSLNVPSGKFVAIVGQSGSGKSTLTKLLPRLYNPQAGRIYIDGIDIAKVELYSLRSQIGIVPQDSLLFDGSVQENIALSDPDATVDQVVSAAKLACAHDFIMSLPAGYATPVGERGGALSGGQRQRVAIARSILQNPRLLIMDEATSALDYETERSVSLNLMDHFRDQTVLFITHRLSSIIHADLIVLMHDGRVEELGTHSELMKRRGRYFALYNQQDSMSS